MRKPQAVPAGKNIRILIAGFGPFPGAPSNPSAALVEALARTRRPALRDVTIAFHVFATRYAAIDRDFPALIAAHDPDIVLMFGLAARTKHIRIETRARNLITFFPDAARFAPATRTIAAGADERRLPAFLGMRLRRAARGHGLKAEFSRDAGRYVCNYAFWRALETTGGNGKRMSAFIHIPDPRRAAGKRRTPLRVSPTLPALTQAAGAILLSALAAYRRHFHDPRR